MITVMDILKSAVSRKSPFHERLLRLSHLRRLHVVTSGVDPKTSFENKLTELADQNKIRQYELNNWKNERYGADVISFLWEAPESLTINHMALIVLNEPDPDPNSILPNIKEVILAQAETDRIRHEIKSVIPKKRIRYIRGQLRLQKALGGGSSWLDVKEY
jgi:hypothetical protein